MSEVIMASLDRDSATSGIQEAIDALGEQGGSVRIPAGKWRLRQSIVLRSGVSLIGDGSATELTIDAPRALFLIRDARKGARSIYLRGQVPFVADDGVGLNDRPRQWWDGTHALVKSVKGNLVRLSEPLNRGLRVKKEAQIVGNILRSNSWKEPGAYPALRLHNVKRFLVQGNRCADDVDKSPTVGGDTPCQTRGIVESGHSDWNLVSGNICTGMAEPITVIGHNSRAQGNLL